MTLGAMQPYLFPYLGYFQLMGCVDLYLFCGDLQFIRHGWVNRNRIVINQKNQEVRYFTFSVEKDDYRKKINERRYSNLRNDCGLLKRSLFQSYRRAPNFEEAYSVIEKALSFQDDNVARFNVNANIVIAGYLGIGSRIVSADTIGDEVFLKHFRELDYEGRVVYLCKYFKASRYVNAIGGMSLYHEKAFSDQGIDLAFLRMDGDVVYPQWGKAFVPNLSIIDVMMNNRASEVKALLKKYQIVSPEISVRAGEKEYGQPVFVSL